MLNISGFGTKVEILATQTFPFGFTVEEFADDKDPIKVDVVEPVGFELLNDGTLFTFDKGAVIKVQVSVVATSDEDLNMKMMLQARKGAQSIIPIPDVTAMVISYGNGGRVAFSGGSIVSGPLADSITQAGRLEGNTYTFVFGSFSGAQSKTEIAVDVVRSLIGMI